MMRDDETVGHVLSRREILKLFGAAGAAWLTAGVPKTAGACTPSCVVRPKQTEGPYFVDESVRRSDIRSDSAGGDAAPGVPLALMLLVSRLSGDTCRPLEGAHVDVWQCDARGVYSGVRDRRFDTAGKSFLRGYQVTDESGEARFTTVYPGWYPGRTVHIHFKIRSAPPAAPGFEFTSQLYFDDALTDRIHAVSPYAGNGQRRTRNRDDGIFRSGGDQLMLNPVENEEGYAASFAVGLEIP